MNFDDFGENLRFPGFGSVDGSRLARHCTCARGFLPIIGRRADTGVTKIALSTSGLLEKNVDFPVSVRSGPLGFS